MTEQEQLMYQIIGKISKTNAPLVFKGALIAKLIMMDSSLKSIERSTRDIDANWMGTPPTMEELVDVVNQSLGSLSSSIRAEIDREYGVGKTAGLRFVDLKNGQQLLAMDIEIKPATGSKLYRYGEIMIRGVLPEAMLSDKISVLSGERIFRRVKDVLDIYSLASCLEIHTADIYSALEKSGRVLGNFEAFISRGPDLEHAYNKLNGIIGKPDFASVYTYLGKFLEPFIMHDMSPKVWRGSTGSWGDISDRLRQKHRDDRDAR